MERNLSRVCVSVRIRPSLDQNQKNYSYFELDREASDKSAASLKICGKQFAFDHIFGDESSQKSVFQKVGAPIVKNVAKGLHGTICAYGATGSGKTHTMLGVTLDDVSAKTEFAPSIELPASRVTGKRVTTVLPLRRESVVPESDEGIAPRCLRYLFDILSEKTVAEDVDVEITVSLLEIYLEKIRDLLRPEDEDQAEFLRVREDTEGSAYVENLTRWPAASPSQAISYLRFGQLSRVVSKTRSNGQSSRSHLLFFVDVTQRFRKSDVTTLSRLTIADLAGSEKQTKTCSEGLTLEEAKKINTSLLAFGRVVNALTSDSSTFPPFRDSALTRVLQESLRGTATMSFICTVAADQQEKQENMTTLRFGQRLKLIKIDAKVNEVRSLPYLEKLVKEQESCIGNLRETVAKLEAEVNALRETSHYDADEDLLELPKKCDYGNETRLQYLFASVNHLKNLMWQLMGVHQRTTAENTLLRRNIARIESLLASSEVRCKQYAEMLTRI